MFQTQTLVVPLAEEHTSVRPEEAAQSVAWPLWMVVAGITSALLGGTLDMAWHMSIGRETFWTPAHIMIQLEAILVTCAALTTLVKDSRSEDPEVLGSTVSVLGLRAPAGAFLCLWGCVAMLSSAPFDNWWHNAYGLDTKIVATPPHVLLLLGSFADKVGALAWIASVRNRSTSPKAHTLSLMLLWIATICVAQSAVVIIAPTWMTEMHTAQCYIAAGIAIPPVLLAAGWGSGFRWGCSWSAGIYTALALAIEWGLPLIPAHPKLGPVYHNVTHFVPLRFPLLLLVPAIACDLLLHRFAAASFWKKALAIGPAFVLTFLAVQWPFASFLMSPASRNWIFGTAYFGYADTAGFLYDPYVFSPTGAPRAFAALLVLAMALAVLTTRLGLGWGNWMRRICR